VSDYDCLLSVNDWLGPVLAGGNCVSPGTFRLPNRQSLSMSQSAPGPCDGDSNHFWSFHIGGSNWLLGDASVRFIQYSAQPITFPMSTRAGGEVIPSNYNW
jgi:hypothetical protein